MLTLALVALLAPPALADGGPVVGIDAGPAGITVPGHAYRYVALPAGDRTLIARIERRGGRVDGYRTLSGGLIVPAVDYNGAPTGLSWDATTLVLATRTYPRRNSGWPIIGAGLALLALVGLAARRVRDNVRPYAAPRLERDVVRADVGAAGGDGEGGPRPAELERR